MSLAVVHHPDYVAPLRDGHGFPMSKYGYLREEIATSGPAVRWFAPDAAGAALIGLAHDADYVTRTLDGTLTEAEIRRIGLPGTERVARRARLATAGTLLAARVALREGIALNAAGGSHHAGREGGAGFCVFNDVAVAASALLAEGAVRRVLVVDADVHQGDGTARIFADDARVICFSIHGARNYPFRKARSDVDVGLADGTGDGPYLSALREGLERALALAPDADIAFYNAGVDVHEADRLGRLALTDAGLLWRDATVFARLKAARLPTVAVMGGGYDRDPALVARRHRATFEAAAAV